MNQKVKTENIYELWYLWLKETEPKDWTPWMQEALQNCEQEFEQWWEDRKQYFLPSLNSEPLWVIENEEDYKVYHEPGEPEGELIVAFNVYMPKQHLIKAFQKLLAERLPGERGRPAFNDSDAELFELYRRPDGPTIRALNMMLNVYKARKEDKEKPMWAIGLECGVNLSAIPTETDTKKTVSDKRKNLTAAVSRYLKWSETLRTNLVLGEFPKYK